MAKKRKVKPFRAVKAVKEMARERIGALPPSRIVPNRKRQAAAKPKHKPTLDDMLNSE